MYMLSLLKLAQLQKIEVRLKDMS